MNDDHASLQNSKNAVLGADSNMGRDSMPVDMREGVMQVDVKSSVLEMDSLPCSYTEPCELQQPLRFEEYLSKYGSLTYRNKGVSMLPLIKEGRDLFTIVPKGPGRCKKYDVILYNDKRGRYILHRIVKVRENDYVVLGDNTYTKEYRTDGDILGVMTSFVRKGKAHTIDEAGYRIYSSVWTFIFPLRRFLLRVKRFAGKVLRAMHLR